MIDQAYIPPARISEHYESDGASPKDIAHSFFDEMQRIVSEYATSGKPLTVYGNTFTTDEEKGSLQATMSVNMWMQDYNNIIEMVLNIQTALFTLEKGIQSDLTKAG
jgi:hypothetical protein